MHSFWQAQLAQHLDELAGREAYFQNYSFENNLTLARLFCLASYLFLVSRYWLLLAHNCGLSCGLKTRKAKTVTIKGDEARAYERLRQWADCHDAARFVLVVLASRPAVAGEPDPQRWLVPSRSGGGARLVEKVCSASYLKIGSKASGEHGSRTSEPKLSDHP